MMPPAPSSDATAGSKPLRALALLGAALFGWGAARLPVLVSDHAALKATLAAPTMPISQVEALAARPVQAPAASDPPAGWRWPVPIDRPYPVYIQVPYPVLTPPQPVAQENAPANAPASPSNWEWPPRAVASTSRSASAPLPAMAVAPSLPTGSSSASIGASTLAEAAYARLQAGDKREAARLFDTAIAADPDAMDSRHVQWQRDAAALRRRWSGEGWTLVRAGPANPATGLSAQPVLGGGQTGGLIGYTVNLLGRRPVALIARINAATDARGALDRRTAQAAFGVRIQPLPGVAVAAERLVAVGDLARDDSLLRLSGGGQRSLRMGVPLLLDGYGEANVLGSGDWLAGGQVRGRSWLWQRPGLDFAAGLGGWGGVQSTSGTIIGRLDVGPTAAVRVNRGRLAFEVSAYYSQRIAGKVDPGSGPVLTVSTAF